MILILAVLWLSVRNLVGVASVCLFVCLCLSLSLSLSPSLFPSGGVYLHMLQTRIWKDIASAPACIHNPEVLRRLRSTFGLDLRFTGSVSQANLRKRVCMCKHSHILCVYIYIYIYIIHAYTCLRARLLHWLWDIAYRSRY